MITWEADWKNRLIDIFKDGQRIGSMLFEHAETMCEEMLDEINKETGGVQVIKK
jgi:hypothetical protein